MAMCRDLAMEVCGPVAGQLALLLIQGSWLNMRR